MASESFTPTVGSSTTSGQTSTTVSTKTVPLKFSSSKGLWSVAARDVDGSMVLPEVLDMVNSPDISTIRPHTPQIEPNKGDGTQHSPTEIRPSLGEQSEAQKTTATKGKKEKQQAVNEKEPSLTTEPLPTVKNNQYKTSDHRASVPLPEMPRYTGYTDAELSKQIACYGFKAVKGRNKMIALLEKCWQNKHPNAAKTSGSSASHQSETNKPQHDDSLELSNDVGKAKPQPATAAQREDKKKLPSQKLKPCGRTKNPRLGASSSALADGARGKKKLTVSKRSETSRNLPIRMVPATANIPMDEIEDSEEEVIPSPTRMKQQRNTCRLSTPVSSSLPLTTKPSPTHRSNTPRPTASISANLTTKDIDDNLPNLFSQITTAVRAQPRKLLGSKHRPQPTWHEKILLYDPIIVEDLASWLNTEGLDLVGEDREVSAAFVRKWCESKGICCCYRAK
jgi:hypothetical protein